MEHSAGPSHEKYRLVQLQDAVEALFMLSDTDKKPEKNAQFELNAEKLLDSFMSFPRGMAHITLVRLAQDGTVKFGDEAKFEKIRAYIYFAEKYGPPNALNTALTDEIAEEIASAAMLDPQVWDYAKFLCAAKLLEGINLPKRLLEFAGYALVFPPPKGKAGRSKLKNILRNHLFWLLSESLQKKFDLPLTRGFGSTSDSVCSIICETLHALGTHMTEETIRKAIQCGDADRAEGEKYMKGIVSSD